MLAKVLTYLLIGVLLIAVVAITLPQYLSYLWLGFGLILVIALAYLAMIYAKKAIYISKQMNKE